MTTSIYDDLRRYIKRDYGNTLDVINAFMNVPIGASKRIATYNFFTKIVKTPREVIDFMEMWDNPRYKDYSKAFKMFAQDVYVEIARFDDDTLPEMLKLSPDPEDLIKRLREK